MQMLSFNDILLPIYPTIEIRSITVLLMCLGDLSLYLRGFSPPCPDSIPFPFSFASHEQRSDNGDSTCSSFEHAGY